MYPSPELVRAYETLRRAPLSSADALRATVLAHRKASHAAHDRDPLVDLDLSRSIAAACLALLDRWPSFTDAQRAHVQAACTWYAQTDDADDDFASLTGFDDDAQVLNHACAQLGLPELQVEID